MTIASPADETIVTIPWIQLHDSPLQYRQTYSDATIAEIAASIKDTGRIHQPLVVRLRYPNPLFRDQYDAQDGFDIVFGHTRKRGGMAAGLAGAPCVVRDLNDAQVRAAQAAENIKDKPEALLAAAAHYGIALTPSTAGASANKAGAGAGTKSTPGKAKARAGVAGKGQMDDAGVAGDTLAAGAQLDMLAGVDA